jgi:hypothetical protein
MSCCDGRGLQPTIVCSLGHCLSVHAALQLESELQYVEAVKVEHFS